MKQKIVFIASFAESIINFRLHLIKEFLQRNYEVVVIAPYDKKVAEQLSQYGIRFLAVKLERNGNNFLKDIGLFCKIFFLLKSEKPDIVFSYTIKPVIYGSIAARLRGVKQIYAMITGTGYIFSNTNLKARLVGFVAKKMFRFALQFNNKLFFQNKDNVASFAEYKLISKNQPLTIIDGSGVDINFFKPTPLPKTISFLMIARLLHDKGVCEYVASARMIKQRYPEISFKLVGWIDTNPNSIKEHELSAWIKEGVIDYLGRLSDVRGAISNSSVYVLPSYGEGTPRTVLEAMAMGRPIITTDVPGCRETVINNLNGFLVPVTKIEPLCKAMNYFIENPAEIEKMGNLSRNRAIEKYDVNKVNKQILKAMNLLLEDDTSVLLENVIG